MPEITGQRDVPLPLNGGAARAANVHRSPGAERLAEPADSLVRPVTKRWTEQRWVLDNVIQANGVDWDQPRTQYWNAACGLQAAPDFARIRQRVHKYADIAPEFADMARIREERARSAQAAGELVTARECYFIAAIHWGAAQWPIDQADDLNRQYNENKRDCFTRYSRLADHHVEPVWVPFDGKALPAWFHLPVGYAGGRVPVVVAIPGMDSFKEAGVALYGDPRFSSPTSTTIALCV